MWLAGGFLYPVVIMSAVRCRLTIAESALKICRCIDIGVLLSRFRLRYVFNHVTRSFVLEMDNIFKQTNVLELR